MACKVTISYAYSKDETRISISDEFRDLPAIHRADALKDALHDLTRLYNETLENIGKETL